MYNMGKRIKELRIQNGLTQEKLAENLGVTYQSVSKWENGVTYPDLSLIVPLAAIFKISTDELLGANIRNIRLKELEAQHENALATGGIKEGIKISGTAVNEFPEDLQWLYRYGWDLWCFTVDEISDENEFDINCKKVISIFDKVISNTEEDALKLQSVVGIVSCYINRGDKKSAKRYVDMLPDIPKDYITKDNLMLQCLENDEALIQSQIILKNNFRCIIDHLLWDINLNHDISYEIAEKIIKSLITDKNYIEFHCDLQWIEMKKARRAMKIDNCEEAIRHIKAALYHAGEWDKINCNHLGEYRYTTDIFNMVTIDSKKWCRSAFCQTDSVKAELVDNPIFSKLVEKGLLKDF